MTGKEETGIFTLYSDVEATAVRWLWYPFIAVGKITLLQGDPGDGKSTMMMNLIAELSKGGTMPDGKSIGMPQKVIYQCSEDDASDTIKPRLESAEADCTQIKVIDESEAALGMLDERIEKAIGSETNCFFYFIDIASKYKSTHSGFFCCIDVWLKIINKETFFCL